MAKGKAVNANTDPAYMLFAAEFGMNGGNASAAARSVGWTPEQGRRVIGAHPELRDAATKRAADARDGALVSWQALHQEALRTIEASLEAEDERVRLQAALAIVERVEGKVAQKIETDDIDTAGLLATVSMRFALALHVAQQIPTAEAINYAQAHPEVVEEWGRVQGLLPPGTE